ncbi:MAG: alpha/beta fold hydrolase, partial [Acidimicrobiales bacterium]|nr:alpha/beta fold hydrolase [Acidimicrobiales bacterium]
PPSPLPSAQPGTLIRYEKVTGIPGVPSGATLYRILYHSRSIYNVDIPESGYVIVPGTTAPSGGYPVISWAHGTTGAAPICAPSLFETDGAGTYLVPQISKYVGAGFLIAATDYEGLGIPGGIHPYLLGESEGRAVLDAAKAAMQLPNIKVSNKVIIYGHSQGGHAALFAGELAPTYASDLKILGVVAAAPATGLTTILAVALAPQFAGAKGFIVTAAWTWGKTYKNLPETDMFSSLGISIGNKYVDQVCTGTLDKIMQNDPTSSILLASAQSNPDVLAHAKENNPGQVKTDAPMLVVQGTSDTTVPPILTDAYVTSSACPIGDTIDYIHFTGATHGTIVKVAAPTILSWMQARLAGTTAPTTCGQSGDLSTASS